MYTAKLPVLNPCVGFLSAPLGNQLKAKKLSDRWLGGSDSSSLG